MKSLRLLALAAVLPALAWAASIYPVYNIWASKPGNLTVLGTTQLATATDCSASINTKTGIGFAYARATTSAGDTYEFQLTSVTSTPPVSDPLSGYWNVTRNGVAVCTQCAGTIFGMTSGAGKPLSISVDGGNYQVAPIITNRYDFYP